MILSRREPRASPDDLAVKRAHFRGPQTHDAINARLVVAFREQHRIREHARFAEAFATLPERQQSALWMSVVEGHSYDEIAGVLGASVQSVKNLVHRARAALADRMQEAAMVAAEKIR